MHIVTDSVTEIQFERTEINGAKTIVVRLKSETKPQINLTIIEDTRGCMISTVPESLEAVTEPLTD